MSYYYHNVTQCLLNETDMDVLISELNNGDLVLFSRNGDATLDHIDMLDRHTKTQFNETLRAHGCDFDKLIIPFGRRIKC